MRVAIAESLGERAFARLEEVGEVVYLPGHDPRQREWKEALQAADALLVRNRTRVDGQLLALAPRLRWVVRLGSGEDNVDRSLLSQKGVELYVPKGANAVGVAEYVLSALFHFARPLQEVSKRVKMGEWRRDLHQGWELYGKTLGILGLGETGMRVALRARSLGMRVVAWAPTKPSHSFLFAEFSVAPRELREVLQESDFLSLHLPLLPETERLLDEKAFALMKRGAVLINTARGGLVDEEALRVALAQGHLGGAVLDVRAKEPPLFPDPLASFPQVLLTPHLAGHTKESLERVAEAAVDWLLTRSAGPRWDPAGRP
ncbi:MAG: hydroxyacid dehydrogenase [Bacillota bacterium]|nr:hydroxyacid dehydrogenase [Bacillota bacterium]